MNIQIGDQAIISAVQRAFEASLGAPGIRNPRVLGDVLESAIGEQADRIRETVSKVVAEFTASDEFAKNIRKIYRDALHGEAARMGRNAAKAIVNTKDPEHC